MKPSLALIGLSCLLAACTNTPAPKPTTNLHVTINQNQQTLQVFSNNQLLETIGVHDVPVFDGSTDSPTVPERDYRFVTSALYTTAGQHVYFTVRNQTTAGNNNADSALFEFNLAERQLHLLASDKQTNGFTILALSPNGSYLAYNTGSHSGVCTSRGEIAVIALATRTPAASVSLPVATTGWVTFKAWDNDHTLRYTEETFASESACEDQNGEGSQVTEKTLVFN